MSLRLALFLSYALCDLDKAAFAERRALFTWR